MKNTIKAILQRNTKIFNTTNYETSLNLLDKLLSNLDDIPPFLKRFIHQKDTSQPQQTHTIHA